MIARSRNAAESCEGDPRGRTEGPRPGSVVPEGHRPRAGLPRGERRGRSGPLGRVRAPATAASCPSRPATRSARSSAGEARDMSATGGVGPNSVAARLWGVRPHVGQIRRPHVDIIHTADGNTCRSRWPPPTPRRRRHRRRVRRADQLRASPPCPRRWRSTGSSVCAVGADAGRHVRPGGLPGPLCWPRTGPAGVEGRRRGCDRLVHHRGVTAPAAGGPDFGDQTAVGRAPT